MLVYFFFVTEALLYFPGDSWYYIAPTVLVFVVQQLLQTRLLLSNPGLAALEDVYEFDPPLREREVRQLYCRECDIIKWGGVEHCIDCNVCMLDNDHHCPWSSKCIADRNLINFHWFVGSTVFFFFYCICSIFGHLERK